MITVSALGKAHGAKRLFRDVTFRLLPGRRIALVGPNGVGKTTLLEIVLGTQEPDVGEVHRGKEIRVGYLPQEAVGTAAPADTVLESVLAGAGPIHELEVQLRELTERVAATTGPAHDKALAAYGQAQSRFEQLGGYALEATAQRVLAGLGFSAEAIAQPLAELSGGWQMRAALARLMVDEPDVLVLDEPTNHLDTDSVSWLESTLAAYPGAILFVSHDRDFIDAVAERVIELAEGTAIEYVGGFAEFVVQREDRLVQLRAAAASQQRQIAHVERFVDRFRYKATKARQVQSRLKVLAKLDRITVPDQAELAARFAFPAPQRSSRVVVELSDVAVGYEANPVLTHVNLVIERGEKLALVGPNGAGKTTLVRLLLGELAPMSGELTRGANVDVAHFAQEQARVLDDRLTVLEEFQRAVGDRPQGRNIRGVLGSFGFSGDTADRRVGMLSGGERTRLALGKIMVNPVNLLVLDEPTNHLDLQSCDVLEDALRVYPGTVVLVSHDRYLIREVAQSLVAVRDGRAVRYDGVDEMVLSPGSAPAPTPTVRAAAAPTIPSRRVTAKRNEAETRQRRHQATKDLRNRADKLERQLGRTEAKVADLQRQLAEPDVYDDNDNVKSLVCRHGEAKDEASRLMDAWTESQLALEAAEARLA